MRAPEALSGTTATTGSTALTGTSNNVLSGGQYALLAVGSTLTLATVDVLGPDGTTYIPAITATVASNKGYGTGYLPTGAKVQGTVSGTTCVLRLVRIPGE